jgi:predicted nucleotidyltransferase
MALNPLRTGTDTEMSLLTADPQALGIACRIHELAGASQTILFGSRARGDHQPGSDIDVLIIKDTRPTERWLENLREQARRLQKTRLPQASGIDVLCMTEAEFMRDRRLRNHLANSIAKQGFQIMPEERLDRPSDSPEEWTNWQDVRDRLNDATDAAEDLQLWRNSGLVAQMSDKGVGRAGQTALENVYKAMLGAHGFEYPVSGRDGHNLRILVDRIRRDLDWPSDQPVPGEEHQYLSEFGGAGLYASEHPALDKMGIATDIPQAVEQLKNVVQRAMPGVS